MNQQQSHIFKISGELKKYIESNPRMFVTKLLCKLASIIPWHLLLWQFYAIYPWKAKRIIEIEKKKKKPFKECSNFQKIFTSN